MNIKKAKEEIKNAMRAYFTKDEFGNYVIPIERQRPIFLMGPPGIGKTAIMEQVAQELGIGMISYSMTHHTRQSALGLPFIEKKIYGGKEYNVSEYTMSEIIASVYDMMEESGLKEGILFLDEINCVSETLAPSMLQFLQYKVFGRHRVPSGWIVVTAGNPPEYNNSVREFDIVTWDRLKRIDIEPSYDVWKEYAINSQVHPSVTAYLDIKIDDFYKVETTVDGKTFVTARGWYDLSDMIKLYEQNGIAVTEDLICQYLQNHRIAKEFSVYYDLFNKYKSDYQVDKILSGNCDESIIERAKSAKFDERISLLGLILDGISSKTREAYYEEETIAELMASLKDIKKKVSQSNITIEKALSNKHEDISKYLNVGISSNSISKDKQYIYNKLIRIYDTFDNLLLKESSEDNAVAFSILKKEFDRRVLDLKNYCKSISNNLDCAFSFCEKAFGDGQEMLIFVTELTSNRYSAYFISRYGCEKYFKHNKELLFYERQVELIQEIENLSLD